MQTALSKFKTSYQAEEDADAAQYSTAKGYLNYVKTSLNDKSTDASGDPTGLIAAIQAFSTKLKTLDDEMNHPDVSGHTAYNDAVTQLDTGLQQLNDAVNVDKTPATAENMSLNQALTQMKDGLDQLKSKVPTLSSGVSDLYEGSKSIYNGTTDPTGVNQENYTLTQALTALNDGAKSWQLILQRCQMVRVN